jgi:hypothetical protein
MRADVEARMGVSATIQYAAERGVTLAPSSLNRLFKRHGRRGTRLYVDKLGAIMDAASVLGIDCTQAHATRRLSLAKGDAQRVIADFTAERRRRLDRQTVTCRVSAPPRAHAERTNAFAGCGCPRCRDRLAAHMKRYIGKMIAAPLFLDLDREEARAEANLELIRSAETWPGGNFTGWFAARFTDRVRAIDRSRSAEEREMLSLDAEGVLSDDHGGRTVSLGERIPDRSVDVLRIVLWREQRAEEALARQQIMVDRCEEYTRRAASVMEAVNSPVSIQRPRLDREPQCSRDYPRRRRFPIRARGATFGSEPPGRPHGRSANSGQRPGTPLSS